MTAKPITEFQIHEKFTLRPGDRFRTRRGSGPAYGKTALGPFSIFQVVALTQARTRVYAECLDLKSGTTHSLYISGPRFKDGDVIKKPFDIKRVA